VWQLCEALQILLTCREFLSGGRLLRLRKSVVARSERAGLQSLCENCLLQRLRRLLRKGPALPDPRLKIKLFWLSRLPESHRLSAQQAAEPLCRNRRFYTVSEGAADKGYEPDLQAALPQPTFLHSL